MRFRKKPVVVEAVQWTGFNRDEIREFCNPGFDHDLTLYIDTLEGTHRARPDDWIIKGVKGEFYPCKPDIFEATHEPE